MAATNINRVVLTGNLTRDPELRSTASGMSVCSLRIASNTRRKNQSTGEWEDKPNYFDVTVWGAQGENCARYLSKGRPVAIDGRLEWREWEARTAQAPGGGDHRRHRPVPGRPRGRHGQRRQRLHPARRAGQRRGLPARRRRARAPARRRRRHPVLGRPRGRPGRPVPPGGTREERAVLATLSGRRHR